MTQAIRPSLITDHLWVRYDLCAAVNRSINQEWAEAPDDAIAEAKSTALLKRGLPNLDVSVAELSVDGGERFETVVLVRDRIARWVLRAGSPNPESLPRLGVSVRGERPAGRRGVAATGESFQP